MFVGPITCDTFATFESRSGLPALAGVGEAEDPDEAKATEPLLKGVVSRDWIESTRICGVWTAAAGRVPNAADQLRRVPKSTCARPRPLLRPMPPGRSLLTVSPLSSRPVVML